MPTNVIYEAVETSTRYDEFVAEAQLVVERAIVRDHVRLMLKESVDGLNLSSSIVMEGIVKDFMEAVAEFFRTLWSLFTTKVKEIYQDNETWLKENESKLDGVDYKNISVTCFPYWLIGRNDYMAMYNEIRGNANKYVNSFRNKVFPTADEEKVKRDIAGKYADSDGNAQMGIYRYLRTKDPNKLTTVTITGDELKEKVKAMSAFMKRYKNMTGELSSLKTQMENELKKINNILDPPNANKESYSLTLEAVKLLFEADEQKDDTPKQSSSQNDAAKEKAEAAKKENGTVQKKDDDQNKANKDVSINGEENYSEMRKGKLKLRAIIYTIMQKLFASILSAAEEKNNKYKKILKNILGSNKAEAKSSDDSAKEEGSGKKDNKEDKKGTKESYQISTESLRSRLTIMGATAINDNTASTVWGLHEARRNKLFTDIRIYFDKTKVMFKTFTKNETSDLVNKVKGLRNSPHLKSYVYIGYPNTSMENRRVENVLFSSWNEHAYKFERLIEDNILEPMLSVSGNTRAMLRLIEDIKYGRFEGAIKNIEEVGVKLLGGTYKEFRLKGESCEDSFMRVCEYDKKPVAIKGFTKGPSLDFIIDRVSNPDRYFDINAIGINSVLDRYEEYTAKVSTIDEALNSMIISFREREIAASMLKFCTDRYSAVLNEYLTMYDAYPVFNAWELDTCISILRDLEQFLVFGGRQDEYLTISNTI